MLKKLFKKRFWQFVRTIIYTLIHLSIFAAFWTGVTTASIVICITLFFVHIWAVTAGYHRYFSHKAFSTSRVFQFILAWLAQSSTQKGVLWWANNHRLHHLHSDTTADLHSPRQHGFLYSHVGWVLDDEGEAYKSYTMIKDLERYPELVWLDKYDLLPTIVLGVLVFLIAGWSGLVVGFLFSRVLAWNATYTINSLSHVYGTQRYNTGDDSRNNFWLALLTLGEGWHNNHHYYASSARQGFFWWEIDITYYILKLLSCLGIVWDLKLPPREILAGNKTLSPKIIARSHELIQDAAIDLPKLSAYLSKLLQDMKKLESYNHASIQKVSGTAKEILLSITHDIPSLKKLPPKLYSIVLQHFQQTTQALQYSLEAFNSLTKEKIQTAIAALENSISQFNNLVPVENI